MKKLTFYLYNSEVNSFDELLNLSKVGEDGYKEIPLSNKANALDFSFKIFIEENKSKPPKWLPFIREYTDYSVDSLNNTVNSFVVLIKISSAPKDRYFAVTGGFGFNALNKDKVELNFGLITTLNSVDPKQIRFVDAKNIDVRTKQKRIMSNVSTEVFDFGINFDEDLVRIVSGYCLDNTIGKKISGADSLSLNCEIELKDLGNKCKILLDKYNEETYKTNFDFIDNIQPVKDKLTIGKLDTNLLQCLSTFDFESGKIAVAYPDQIDYERCNYFKVYGTNKRNYEIEEVDITIFTEILHTLEVIDIETIKDKDGARIVGFDEDNRPNIGSESLYGFLLYETELDGSTFILSNKKWFKVSENYKNDVNNRLTNAVETSGPLLHDWSKFENKYLEGKYNDTYRNDPEFVVLDREFFQIPNSKSKIEIADLQHNGSKRLICVKKLSASSTLSHLFAQGSVSVDLLKSVDDYRVRYEQLLRNKWPNADVSLDGIKLTYAIGTKKSGEILDIIPFFSKINLLHHAEFVKKMGIKVEITKIKLV